MVVLLIFNVSFSFIMDGLTHGKSGVTSLPGKLSVVVAFPFNPSAAVSFYFLRQFCQSYIL